MCARPSPDGAVRLDRVGELLLVSYLDLYVRRSSGSSDAPAPAIAARRR